MYFHFLILLQTSFNQKSFLKRAKNSSASAMLKQRGGNKRITFVPLTPEATPTEEATPIPEATPTEEATPTPEETETPASTEDKESDDKQSQKTSGKNVKADSGMKNPVIWISGIGIIVIIILLIYFLKKKK